MPTLFLAVDSNGVASLQGSWVLDHLPAIKAALAMIDRRGVLALDGSSLAALDTAGAQVLVREFGALERRHFSRSADSILSLVSERLAKRAEPEKEVLAGSILTRIGRGAIGSAAGAWRMLSFLGHICAGVGESAVHPKKNTDSRVLRSA